MNLISRQNKWAFGLRWILANGFAWGVFYLVDILIRWAGGLTSSSFMLEFFPLARYDYFTALWIGSLACALVWGALVGLLQWLVLRRRLLKKGWWWILATMIGLIPLTVYLFLYQVLTSAVGLSGDFMARLELLYRVVEFVAPVWLGALQWLVFRRTYRRSAWWIVAVTVVVGLVTFSFPSLAAQVFRPHHALLLLAPGALGLLYAVLTWIVLVLLPPRPAPRILAEEPLEAPDETLDEVSPEMPPETNDA